MNTLNKEVLERALKAKGYRWYEDKVNIIGIRTSDTTPNVFNDYLTITWKENGKWEFLGFEATTDPGLYWLKNPGNVKGTAIVVPGQYLNLWQHGFHSGYPALVQTGNKIKVIRDNDRNDYLNMNGPSEEGYFGINCHRTHASLIMWKVDKWSAGCQVIRNSKSWDRFYAILKRNKQDFYTYTLLTEQDL